MRTPVKHARLTINRRILRDLKSALSYARLENCAVDAVHKEAMHLYLRSWVVAPLERALEDIDPEYKKTPMWEERKKD